jgi:hypothetical protein
VRGKSALAERGYFPRLLSQSAFNRRMRDLGEVLGQLGPALAQHVEQTLGPAAYEVLDGVPVPLMRRCRSERHRLFGDEAGLGCGGSDREWYYGPTRGLTCITRLKDGGSHPACNAKENPGHRLGFRSSRSR